MSLRAPAGATRPDRRKPGFADRFRGKPPVERGWGRRRESNPQPQDYKSRALPVKATPACAPGASQPASRGGASLWSPLHLFESSALSGPAGSEGLEPSERHPVAISALPTSHASPSVRGVKRCSLPLCHCAPLPGPQLRAVFPAALEILPAQAILHPDLWRAGACAAGYCGNLRHPEMCTRGGPPGNRTLNRSVMSRLL